MRRERHREPGEGLWIWRKNYCMSLEHRHVIPHTHFPPVPHICLSMNRMNNVGVHRTRNKKELNYILYYQTLLCPSVWYAGAEKNINGIFLCVLSRAFERAQRLFTSIKQMISHFCDPQTNDYDNREKRVNKLNGLKKHRSVTFTNLKYQVWYICRPCMIECTTNTSSLTIIKIKKWYFLEWRLTTNIEFFHREEK